MDAPAARHAELATAIRALSMDAVHGVNSGHPGLPLGAADIATVLFTRVMNFDPASPDWPDRDRFVLSAGHGSMLLYALAYLLGYETMTIDEIKRFRRLHSKTPGHPEYDLSAGIEATTGPLGQGLGMAVGMALSECMLRERFGPDLVDHRTYCLVGDGCLMEGISYEAVAFAGHLGLDRLTVIFDDNGISIDGPTALATSEDQKKRFEACGWDYFACDGHDPDAILAALDRAQASGRPSLIAAKTEIGIGLPNKAGTAAAHGQAPTADEVAGARAAYGWDHPPFVVPDDILAVWRQAGARGRSRRESWGQRLAASPDRQRFLDWQANAVPAAVDQTIETLKTELADKQLTEPTRKSSQTVMGALLPVLPNLIGGSADLTPSNLSRPDTIEDIARESFAGRYIRYGIREHAMAAVSNGIALHKGFMPFCATFLIFSDYCRPAMRLSALQEQHVIYVLTHDTITMGPDGPTHQSVEQFAALRATPNMLFLRPADAVEVAECWQIAVHTRDRPVCIVLTREAVPPVRRDIGTENRCRTGAYEISPALGDARVSLLATGSEVWVALGAQARLEADGVPTRVVSMPSFELFEAQDDAFRMALLRPETLRVSIEAATTFGWDRYVGESGLTIGMTTFGASGLPDEVMDHFGFSPDKIADAVRRKL